MTLSSHNRISAMSRRAALAALWRPTSLVCSGVSANTPANIGIAFMLQGFVRPEHQRSDYRLKQRQ
jgi:hypothetical protein